MEEPTPKILAVDDSENVLKTLNRIIVKGGCRVDTASDGAAALDKIRAWLPDVVVLDVVMPVMDGIELCRRLKEDPKLNFIWVLMLTDKDQVADEVTGLDAGADDYIAKPFSPDVLMARVRKGLRIVSERRDAFFDGLTRLYNKRVFELLLKQETAKSERHGAPLSLILVDLDHFKAVNDTHGHAAGDGVLQHLAAILRDNTRVSDLAVRWGGEEMAVLLPQTDEKGALAMAENLRGLIEGHDFPVAGKVTASFGVAEYSAEAPDMFHAADRALYRAKQRGRNQVAVESADKGAR